MAWLDEALAARSAMRGEMWDEIAQVPTWFDWADLRDRFIAAVHRSFAKWIAPDQAHFREQLLFAIARFDEGAGLVRYFEHYSPRVPPAPRSLNILDLGAGNGGVALALANCRRFRVHTLDIVPNNDLRVLRDELRLPVRPVVASGHHIPFSGNSFDVLLVLDTIEHVPQPGLLAEESMRVLRAGGVCMITTPARIRHFFGPDPHYGIRGLVLFPNRLQRLIVNRLFQRKVVSSTGQEEPAYDVEHIFWHVAEVSRLFPGRKTVDVLYNRPFGPATRFSREWWRYKARKFLWDRVLIYKEG